MGADTAASHLIFFIVSVIIALSVAGGIFMNVQSISTAATIGSRAMSEQLKTDITVINDPDTIPYDSSAGVYIFYVKNTGKEELSPVGITVLIDGVTITDGNINKTVIQGGTVWRATDVLKVNATVTLGTGSHKIRVVTGNGIDDEFEFRR
ncbi:MAG: flagellar protein G [Candidatus Methanoperedens sp.]|nr:flagellar protein G [Candidatus Methanoperedens sp.]